MNPHPINHQSRIIRNTMLCVCSCCLGFPSVCCTVALYDVTLFRQQQAVMHKTGRSDTTNMQFEVCCNMHQMHVAHESRAHRFWQRFMFDTCCISNRIAIRDFTLCLLWRLYVAFRLSDVTCSTDKTFQSFIEKYACPLQRAITIIRKWLRKQNFHCSYTRGVA